MTAPPWPREAAAGNPAGRGYRPLAASAAPDTPDAAPGAEPTQSNRANGTGCPPADEAAARGLALDAPRAAAVARLAAGIHLPGPPPAWLEGTDDAALAAAARALRAERERGRDGGG